MRRVSIVVAAAAALGASVAIFSAAPSPVDAVVDESAQMPEEKPLDADEDDLRAELLRQRSILRELEQRLGEVESPGERHRGGSVVVDSNRRPAPVSFEEAVERAAEERAALEAELDREQRDEAWASQTEEHARRAADGVHAPVSTVSCRASFCRMAIDDHAGVRQTVSALLGEPPISLGGGLVFFDPNRSTATLFFAREGHQLPQPE